MVSPRDLNLNDVEMAGISPQVNLTMEHTNPHVGDAVDSPPDSPKVKNNELKKEEAVQN
jgi:hypothetical protein